MVGQRNVVEVEWLETHIKNIYRAGYKGRVNNVLWINYTSIYRTYKCVQVDVKCSTFADGGYFYPEHLPVLGRVFCVHC